MPLKNNPLSKYYGKNGQYLKDHDVFLRTANTDKDISFLIKALGLKKNDRILDIACGQGRHTTALAQKGYSVDGIDFSKYLLSVAQKKIINKPNCQPKYFYANIEKFKLKNQYKKAYWFFSDLANIDLPKAISSINHNMVVGGKVLFDTDNIFRIISYLQTHSQTNLVFDTRKLELIDKQAKVRAPYPVLSIWEKWFMSNGFSLERIIGNYDFEKYSITSKRLIMVIKKTA